MSIIKINSIEHDANINNNEIIQLRGITDGYTQSIGTTPIKLRIVDKSIKHKFHIVEDEFPIPSDGIIGKDFIQKHFCKLDYYEMEFTIRYETCDIIIPINGGPKANIIAIPPRCEVFRVFECTNFTETTFIENDEIAPGIFIANTIAHHPNPIIRVINTTEKTALVPNVLHKNDPVKNFDIFKIEKPDKNDHRAKSLNKIFAKNTPPNKLKLITELPM